MDLEEKFNALMVQIEQERQDTGEMAEDVAWEVEKVTKGLDVPEDQAVSMLDAYYEDLERRGFVDEAGQDEI